MRDMGIALVEVEAGAQVASCRLRWLRLAWCPLRTATAKGSATGVTDITDLSRQYPPSPSRTSAWRKRRLRKWLSGRLKRPSKRPRKPRSGRRIRRREKEALRSHPFLSRDAWWLSQLLCAVQSACRALVNWTWRGYASGPDRTSCARFILRSSSRIRGLSSQRRSRRLEVPLKSGVGEGSATGRAMSPY